MGLISFILQMGKLRPTDKKNVSNYMWKGGKGAKG